MGIRDFIKKISKEAYLAPIAVSLFLIPIFWNPSFLFSFTQGKEILFKAILLVSLLVFATIVLFRKKFDFGNIFKSPLFFLLLLLITVFALTNALSSTSIVALHGTYSRGFGFIIELFLFTFTIYCALTLAGKNISKLLKVVFASGFLVALYSIFQKIGLDPFFDNFDTNIFAGRIFSFLGNPSYLGQFMLLITIISGFLAVSEKKRTKKAIYIVGTLVFLSALFFSETRTALVGLAFAILLVSVKNFKQIISFFKRYKPALLIVLVFGAILITVLPNDRYSFSNLALRSLNSRLEIWDGTLDLIKEKPILGYGEETFYIYFPEIITKEFLTLEENINLSADRIHNETLEILFSHGIFAVIIYLLILVYLFKIFFKSKNKIAGLLSLVIIINIIQNQLAFPDITISILIAFCFGGLIALESENKREITLELTKWKRFLLTPAIVFFVIYLGYQTVYRPHMSQLAYAESHKNYTIDYATAVNKHKEALSYTPYYSELWYELMFIDPSSMERALFNLEAIEGDSGNVLAWKGNFYADSDPQKASEFYTRALGENPHHPNWIRAYADMLYEHEDYENALFLYNQYLEAIPDFWKWTNELEEKTAREQKTYETFLKHTPYFWGILEKIEHILSVMKTENQN